jgi:hypothetical protein
VARGVFAGEVEGGGGDVVAVMWAWGRWVARAMAMAPEPVPTSRMRRGLAIGLGSSSVRTASTRMFGLGARDEDGGGDAEGEAVELLLAGDVLDGLVGEAAADEGVIGGLLFVVCERGRGWRELRRGRFERVQQQQVSASRAASARRSRRRFELGWWRGRGLRERVITVVIVTERCWMRRMLPSGSVTEIMSRVWVLPLASVAVALARWKGTCWR